MATVTKTPRLLAAAKEFNIGKETLVEFLTSKDFEINASNPNTKLTEEMYDALQREFAQDKLAKRKSEEIALPKGSMMEGRKHKDEIDLSIKAKKEEVPPAPVVEKKKEEQPKAEKPKEEAQPKEAEAPKAAVATEAVAAPEPVAEEKPKKATKKEEAKETPKEATTPE